MVQVHLEALYTKPRKQTLARLYSFIGYGDLVIHKSYALHVAEGGDAPTIASITGMAKDEVERLCKQ